MLSFGNGADQNMLNWAAWLRMHHQDPKWAVHVIQESSANIMDFSRLHQLASYGDKVIAGICSEVYTWKLLYISVFFVEEKYRNQGLGTILINKVEEKAKQLGVTLAHLDTFDFQAKDFYLKHGYEVFGILDDCPQGHKRYYMRKIL
ncbi:GNAT family acetyltransferase [Legionella rubrilucens]|uniref:GNAT family acetyltransferase n=1 Tax=Legionella rubrilucens TaxID=458 RepID=A0A0W0XTT5_9GAMM|nr:GNAT family N-acetyltransferase [Legionella rubrilucens]KTD48056.1 GNAT family acetyltransferase [Legionella rubrilucens]